MSGSSSRPPILVLVLAAAFLLLVASLLIGAFTKPEFPPYPVTAGPGGGQYTFDASAGDRWRRFSFSSDSLVETGPWDIAFRRNHVVSAPGAAVRDLGPVSFDSLGAIPTDGYVATTFGADTSNSAIGKWYAYSMLSHLLTSKRHVYAVRTAAGGLYAFEVLAYYCKDVGAACYTIRYKKARPRI